MQLEYGEFYARYCLDVQRCIVKPGEQRLFVVMAKWFENFPVIARHYTTTLTVKPCQRVSWKRTDLLSIDGKNRMPEKALHHPSELFLTVEIEWVNLEV